MNTVCRNMIFLMVAAFGLSACGESRLTDAEYMQRAEAAYAKSELRAAILDLKNILQENPDHAEARFMLGKIYLEIGDGRAAGKELRYAKDKGFQHPELPRQLATALLLQGENGQVLESVAADTQDAALLVVRGEALSNMGEAGKANQTYQQALKLDPKTVSALFGLARLAAEEHRYQDAKALLKQAEGVNPDSAELWTLKGNLAVLEASYDLAEQYYQESLSRQKAKILTRLGSETRLGMVRALIAQGKDDAALAQVDTLTNQKSPSPLLDYFRGLIAYRKGQFAPALESFLKVEKQVGDYLPNTMLLGASYFALKQYQQAERHLTTFVTAMPEDVRGRKMLAAVQMRLNQPEQALEVLNPAMSGDVEDAELLALVGHAAARSGDLAKGIASFRKAIALDPSAKEPHNQLAAAYIQGKQYDKAIKELEANLGDNPEVRSVALLVTAHLQKKDFDSARKVVEEFIGKFPAEPKGYNLLGGVYLLEGNGDEARAQFKKAMEVEPKFIPALISLAVLDQREGKLDSAKQQLEKVLEVNDKNIDAMVGLAKIAERQKQQEKAIEWLNKARAVDPAVLTPRLLLGRYYLRKADFTKAEELATELTEHHPDNLDVLNFRGALYSGMGAHKDAVTVYRQLVRQRPKLALAHYKLGRALAAVGNVKQARSSLEQADQLEPKGYVPAASLLVVMDAKEKQYAKAQKRIDRIKKNNPDSPAGYILDGDLLMQQQKFAEAAKAYAKASTKFANSDLTIKQFQALGMARRSNDAKGLLVSWLQDHPDDIKVRLLLASSLYSDKDVKGAIEQYRQVLKSDPNNFVGLNDLAWILYESKESPAEGLKLAKQAHELAPKRPEAMDTYGWLLVEEGDVAKGLPLLEQAYNKLDKVPDVAYHYAAALAKDGQKSVAKGLLDKAMASGKPFQSREQAKKLHASLN